MPLNGEKKINVILVEDNPGDARLVFELIGEADPSGFRLTHVSRLAEAIAHLEAESHDVVLLDLSLPDAHGLRTVKEILSRFPGLPIVVLSGLDDEALAIQAVQAGAQDYLVKGMSDGNLLIRSLRYAIERKQTEERLTYLAQFDHLTGLANRTLFNERLTQALSWADRNDHLVALLFLDLDHFKSINDSLGHNAGDRLLISVAERLKKCVRKTDVVSRFGGDEFTVILEGLNSAKDAAAVAQKILETLHPPFDLNAQEVYVTASLGITIYPHDGGSAEELLRYADTAMYRAKDQGRNTYQYFTADMNKRAFEMLAFRNSLHKALDNEEFLIHYQPFVDVRTNRIIAAEALLRWQHPQYGLVYPGRFIPLAEESELIIPIGAWVLRKACERCKSWNDAGLGPIGISVNLSARQFRQRDLPEVVNNILAETGLDPGLLSLELTEGSLMDDPHVASGMLFMLREMGVHISIDDFGTGYSSLSYLKRFPIETLKIAQTFVFDINKDSDDAAIAGAIIALSHSLHLDVVAEGVENHEQLLFLIEHGCDIVQGNYFSFPIPNDELVLLLQHGLEEIEKAPA